MDQREAEKCTRAFEKTLEHMLYVKYHSSPTAKIEFISKLFLKIIPGAYQTADYMLNLIIYLLIALGKRAAELYIEHQYIHSFCHEEMKDKIEQYQHIAQINNGLMTLIGGFEQHLGKFQQGIGQGGSSSRSMSLASNSNSDQKRNCSVGERVSMSS